jgi:hypothetical protein
MRKCRSFALISALFGMLAPPETRADCPITLDLRDPTGELPGKPGRKVRNVAGFRIVIKDARFTRAPESRRNGTTFDFTVPFDRKRILVGGFYARRGIGGAVLAGTDGMQIVVSAPMQSPTTTLSISLAEDAGGKRPPRIWMHVFQTGMRLEKRKVTLNAQFSDFRRSLMREQRVRNSGKRTDGQEAGIDPSKIVAWEIGFFGDQGRNRLTVHSISFCR